MLENLKKLLGIADTSQDELLSLIILQVEQETKDYCNLSSALGLEGVMLYMCVFRYNQCGGEGATAQSYSSVHYNYMDDYPAFIVRQLQANRKIRTV